ncbi:MAG TPA: OmpA family protein [Desulfuromonadales bacterium]|nr:OmpA family protein [Desulfuromonadales bacterium]
MQRIVFFLLAASLLSGGCVSKTRYEEKAAEAELLRQSITALETEYRQLEDRYRQQREEKNELNNRLKEVLQDNSELQQDILRARADLDRMERLYTTKNEEAGRAMSQMRATIDDLQEQNRELAQQLERERRELQEQVSKLKGTYDQLVGKLEQQIERGEVTISELEGKLTVNMVERIIFASGEAEIKPQGLEVLRDVGNVLKDVEDKAVRVEGHTDNVPISPRLQETYPTNWELSSARAVNVVRFLQEKIGIPGEKLFACGFGKFRPIADNGTAEGRARNRRIQIVLVPEATQEATTAPFGE